MDARIVQPFCVVNGASLAAVRRARFAPVIRRERHGAVDAAVNARTCRAVAHYNVGVVIVDHGSRRKESNEMLDEFVDLFSKTTGWQIVEPAHMEIAAPSIEDAVSKCKARGATKVVIAPYFLSRGRHIHTDIPALLAAAQQLHPELLLVQAEPIGVDPLMAAVIGSRVEAALREGNGGISGEISASQLEAAVREIKGETGEVNGLRLEAALREGNSGDAH